MRMRIDRGTFLALCGAIACKVEQPPPAVPVVAISTAPMSTDVPPAASSTEGAAAPCDDSAASDIGPACEGMQDPTPCPSDNFAREQCDQFVPLLEPHAAAEYAACMRALSPADLCDSSAVYGCKEKALRDACLDASVAEYCAAEGQPTTNPDAGCMLWAKGLNELGRRTAMESCGFSWGCMQGLGSPSSE
jgi:hypothetical protein